MLEKQCAVSWSLSENQPHQLQFEPILHVPCQSHACSRQRQEQFGRDYLCKEYQVHRSLPKMDIALNRNQISKWNQIFTSPVWCTFSSSSTLSSIESSKEFLQVSLIDKLC